MVRMGILGLQTWLTVLAICFVDSATDESLSLQRYLPLATDEQLLSNSKRFQQIMQGATPTELGWRAPAKVKSDQMNVKLEIEKLNIDYVYQGKWPEMNVHLGAVTAVSFDTDGNVVIFHRVDHIWTQTTFNLSNVYTEIHKGPISKNTVLALDRQSGHVVYAWGKNIFYMPHGLTVDHENNVWVTDVALHQVFKFGPRGSGNVPLLTLGTAFTPGGGETKFCKPTSVAILQNGDFFVADGYCNARILKYSKDGKLILSWGQNSFSGDSYEVAPKNFFAIPHALTLVPDKELLCAADRENGRVQCFFWHNCTFHSQYHSQIIGDRLFSMAYTHAQGGQLVIVNGPTPELGVRPEHYNEVRGYVLDMDTKKVISKFGPNDLQFSNPHDVAVTDDGHEVYVAELDPMRIHKFVHKSVAKSLPISASKPTIGSSTNTERVATANAQNQTMEMESPHVTDADDGDADSNDDGDGMMKTHNRPGGTAILVATLMLLFAFLTFAMALLVARRRKRGCMPFGVKNRRHAWDFPSKPEGFKLGGLLMERSKNNGFEKLNQNASDEETEPPTNSLASAQFA